jgi:hypothetical protein
MGEFVAHVKEMRRMSRGKEKAKKNSDFQRAQAPATSPTANP